MMQDKRTRDLAQQAERTLQDYRIGKRHIIVMMIFMAIFDLVALGYILLSPELRQVLMPRPVTEVMEPEHAPVPAVEPAPEPEPIVPVDDPDIPVADPTADDLRPRGVLFSHDVRWGDTFWSLAGRYWDSEYYWPDLWLLNRDRLPDPDMIFPGNVVMIYDSLGEDGVLNRAERDYLAAAFVEAYRVYRRIGQELIDEGRRSGRNWMVVNGRHRINKAQWALYSATRFDPDYFDRYRHLIDDRDLRIVRGYLDTFGYPELRDGEQR